LIIAQERPEYDHNYLPRPIERRDKRGDYRKSRRLRQESSRKKLAITGTVLACFVLGLFISYYFAKVIILGYKITVTEKELAQLQMENEYLAGEIDKLSSLDYIEKVAKNELGMIEPGKDDIIMIAVAPSRDADNYPGITGGQDYYTQMAQNQGDYSKLAQGWDSDAGAVQERADYPKTVQRQDNYAEVVRNWGEYSKAAYNNSSDCQAAQKPEIEKKNPVIETFAGLLGMNDSR